MAMLDLLRCPWMQNNPHRFDSKEPIPESPVPYAPLIFCYLNKPQRVTLVCMPRAPRPEYDVAVICQNCGQVYGTAPSTTFYPTASIYEFDYGVKGSHPGRVFFCCKPQTEVFLAMRNPVSELVQLVWHESDQILTNVTSTGNSGMITNRSYL